MKKILLSAALLLVTSTSYAQLVCVGEEDGDPDPDALCVYSLKFTNGDVTDNNDGTASIDTSGGGGGGASELTGLSDVNSATVTAGNMLIANGTGFDSVAMSGDVEITQAGVTSFTGTVGDITAVWGCILGSCQNITTSGTDTLNFSGVDVSSAAEGVFLPQNTDCSSGTGEGQTCWDTDDDQLYIGDSSTNKVFSSIDINTSTATAGHIIIADGTDFESVELPMASSGGADGDSSTTQSDSGLELVSNRLALLRGCDDNQILKWDESQDDWNCEADSTAGGGLSGLDDVNSATVTSGNLLMADGIAWHSVTLTGDVTASWNGPTALGDDVVEEADMDTGYILLRPESAKLGGGSCVTVGDATQPAQIDGSEQWWMLLYDDDVDEGACWSFIMPETYNATSVTVDITYTMASANTSDEVTWEANWVCGSDGDDIDTLGFGGFQTQTTTVGDAAGSINVTSISFTSVQADNLTKGDICTMNLSTDADGGAGVDDATGDREVRGVMIRW